MQETQRPVKPRQNRNRLKKSGCAFGEKKGGWVGEKEAAGVQRAVCSTRAPPGVEVEGGRKEVSVTCYRSRRLSLYEDKALTFPRTSLRVEL